ncbi:MAG: ThuA domain-containing protein [Pyrinomonadaceae bacterium]|nr:ThuA domain-containing protein [Sphingobacteriaceae bacterium]
MSRIYRLTLAIILAGVFFSTTTFAKKPVKVLIFSKTLAYRHKSIKDGIIAIQKLAAQNGFIADTTENPLKITPENLKNYKALIFLSPTGEVLNDEQKQAFQKYIQNGGGFVGIHAATDCLYKWEWYGRMIGAYFTDHPKMQTATLNVTDTKHSSTMGLSSPWKHTDEWYNFKFNNADIKVLIKVDEKSYIGGKNGDNHPVSWYHKFEGGRIFYTALGHTAEAFTSDEMFLRHLLGGIKYATKMK